MLKHSWPWNNSSSSSKSELNRFLSTTNKLLPLECKTSLKTLNMPAFTSIFPKNFLPSTRRNWQSMKSIDASSSRLIRSHQKRSRPQWKWERTVTVRPASQHNSVLMKIWMLYPLKNMTITALMTLERTVKNRNPAICSPISARSRSQLDGKLSWNTKKKWDAEENSYRSVKASQAARKQPLPRIESKASSSSLSKTILKWSFEYLEILWVCAYKLR